MQDEQDRLDAWIDALPGRVVRGELRDLAPVKADLVMMGAEQAAIILLADLDHHARLLTRRHADFAIKAERQRLLDRFRQLREHIG